MLLFPSVNALGLITSVTLNISVKLVGYAPNQFLLFQ